MNLRFLKEAGEPTRGRLIYDPPNQEFVFEPFDKPALEGGLVAQYLQLFVEAGSHRVSWAEGRSAQTSWHGHSLGEPPAIDGTVRVSVDAGQLVPGVAVEVPGAWGWANSFDKGTGWFRSGSVDAAVGPDFVRIAAGTVLEIGEDSLMGIWLRVTA